MCTRKVGIADDVDPTITPPPATRVFNVSATLPNALALTRELIVRCTGYRHNVIPASVSADVQLFLFYAAAWHEVGPGTVADPPGSSVRMPTGDITSLTTEFNVPAFIRLSNIQTTDGAEGVDICVSLR